MMKIFKIILNLAVFFLIIVFIWWIFFSTNKGERLQSPDAGQIGKDTTMLFVSRYAAVASFELPEEINRFEQFGGKLFIAAGQSVYIYTEGEPLTLFPVKQDVRDIAVAGENIYVLYPSLIEVYTASGTLSHQWEACSELSDYCSLTCAKGFIFVTDAENKNICKYTSDGNFVKFIESPRDFIIPSYSFDIDSWNDTLYCANSGRHLVESYTVDGDFIAAFGGPGSQAGSFVGCCNPAYISFTTDGNLITSEKGNPRISLFSRNGSFNEVLLNSRLLGGGNKAYEVKAHDNKLFVAGKNKITVYQLI
ncbi:MAG: hypothetical protein LBV41_09095 [Cytophagaceae bacterium]|jgi:hypothetical protein|nr:hypothetical protein [Cytophagaceae bacterium]